MTARNNITGDLIKTKGVLSKQGEANFDAIFGKKDKPANPIAETDDEKRIDIIGQNGNDGLHYEGDK